MVATPAPARRSKSLAFASFVCGAVVCSFLAGCSGERDFATVPTFKTAGKVTFKGQPIEGASIVLHRQGEPLTDVPAPSARTSADGSFAATTFAAEDGAPAGEYVATIEWHKIEKINGDWANGPNLLPAAYADPGKSPLKFTIAEGDNVLPPIEVR